MSLLLSSSSDEISKSISLLGGVSDTEDFFLWYLLFIFIDGVEFDNIDNPFSVVSDGLSSVNVVVFVVVVVFGSAVVVFVFVTVVVSCDEITTVFDSEELGITFDSIKFFILSNLSCIVCVRDSDVLDGDSVWAE